MKLLFVSLISAGIASVSIGIVPSREVHGPTPATVADRQAQQQTLPSSMVRKSDREPALRPNRERSVEIAGELADGARVLHDMAQHVPRRFAIRKTIVVLSERVARASRELSGSSGATSGPRSGVGANSNTHHRSRIQGIAEDTENLLEAICSLRNTANAEHDAATAQEARQMIGLAWTLRQSARQQAEQNTEGRRMKDEG